MKSAIPIESLPAPGALPINPQPAVPNPAPAVATKTPLVDDKKRPVTPPFKVTVEEVKTMLIRSDPKACSATSDAGLGETVGLYGRIAVQFGSKLAVTAATNNAELQKTLDEFRPFMRELSRNTIWLPVAAEGMIGNQLYKIDNRKEFKPQKRHLPLVEQTIKPLFAELKRYASEELKSPLDFRMNMVQQDDIKAPYAIAGGIIVVPSGMIAALQAMKDPDPVVAFMLAHEFSHALRRHETKLVQMSLVDSMTIAKQFKQIVNTTGQGFSSITDLGQMFSFGKDSVQSLVNYTCKSRDWFSSLERDQEFEADVCGSMLLKKLGDHAGRTYSAVDGYNRYLEASLGVPTHPKQDGLCTVPPTHPDPPERLQNLKAYAAALAAAQH